MHTAQLTFLVYAFVEMFEKEIVSQTVTSGTRMVYTASHHRLSQPFRTGILVGAIRLAKSYKSRYRKRTNRSESVGVCDHASCDVSGQEFTPPKRRFWKAEPNLSEIEHTFGQVGFSLPKSSFGEHRVTKADIARRVTTNRSESVGVCDHASCLVMFLAKSYKSRYRTTTNRSESVGARPGTSAFVDTTIHLRN